LWRTIRAFTITRRGLVPRSLADRFSASAAFWPRPIREHLPFPVTPLRRRPCPRICAGVSGRPLAFAAARIT